MAALTAAALLLTAHLSGAPAREDPWKVEQREVVKQFERATVHVDRATLEARLMAHPSLRWRVSALAWFGVVTLGLGCLMVWRVLRRVCRRGPAFPHQPVADALSSPWGVWDLVTLLAWLFCGAHALSVIQAVVVRAWSLPELDRHLAATINTVLVDALAIGLVAVLILRRHRLSMPTLGLRGAHVGRQVAIGLWGYGLWVPLFVAAVAAVMGVMRWLRLDPAPQAVVVMLLHESRPPLLFLLMGIVAILGPMAEEIVFRGVAYPALRRRWGVWWGLCGSASLFAVMHADPVAFGPILVLGILLGWLYEQSGSLIPSMTVHILHNSVMLVMAMTVRDLLRLLDGSA